MKRTQHFKINDQTKEYSELHDITQEEIDQIDNEIKEAIKSTKTSKQPQKEEEKKPTTTKPTATKPNETTTEHVTEPTTEEETTEDEISSDFINMTYPCLITQESPVRSTATEVTTAVTFQQAEQQGTKSLLRTAVRSSFQGHHLRP